MSTTRWATGVCEADGVTIHYLRTGGARPPLVLLHGLTGNGACWSPLARALEGRFDVVMPDARGHGRSGAPLHGYRYEDHARDVMDVIEGLGLAAPALLGHSMGGMTAAVAAAQTVGIISAVILADPTFLSPERQRDIRDSDAAEQHRRILALERADLVAEMRSQHPRRSPEIVELLADARLKTRMSAWDVLTPPNPDYRQLVSSIRAPVLLVTGDDGAVVSPETAGELQGLNPRLQIYQIQGAGHGVPYDQPEHFAAVVGAFLRYVVPAGTAPPPDPGRYILLTEDQLSASEGMIADIIAQDKSIRWDRWNDGARQALARYFLFSDRKYADRLGLASLSAEDQFYNRYYWMLAFDKRARKSAGYDASGVLQQINRELEGAPAAVDLAVVGEIMVAVEMIG